MKKTRQKSSAGSLAVTAPAVTLPVQAPESPAEPAPNKFDFAALRDALHRRGEDDAWAASLAALLEPGTPALETAEAASLPMGMRVLFDNRFEHCFEQMLSLIHRQNVQIAELWQLVSDLV